MKSIMSFEGMPIYTLRDAEKMKLIQLSKWLESSPQELSFCKKEVERITKDGDRKSVIVYHEGRFAIFVNDLTNGEFITLADEEDN